MSLSRWLPHTIHISYYDTLSNFFLQTENYSRVQLWYCRNSSIAEKNSPKPRVFSRCHKSLQLWDEIMRFVNKIECEVEFFCIHEFDLNISTNRLWIWSQSSVGMSWSSLRNKSRRCSMSPWSLDRISRFCLTQRHQSRWGWMECKRRLISLGSETLKAVITSEWIAEPQTFNTSSLHFFAVFNFYFLSW